MINKRNTRQSAFPAGLHQPPGSFRFSADALLLAAFARPAGGSAVLDLGTGCGVAAFALCLCHADLNATGIEIQPELVKAARMNAKSLQVAGRFRVLHADAGEPGLFASGQDDSGHTSPHRLPDTLAAETFDLAIANPPYRKRDQGRLPPSPLRLAALFELPNTLAVFCAAAATALKPNGAFCLVYPHSRLADALAAMARNGLHPARIRSVLPRKHSPPSLVLLESRKSDAQAGGPEEEPALVLHEDAGSRFTAQALDFCPFLSPAARVCEAGEK